MRDLRGHDLKVGRPTVIETDEQDLTFLQVGVWVHVQSQSADVRSRSNRTDGRLRGIGSGRRRDSDVWLRLSLCEFRPVFAVSTAFAQPMEE